MERPNGNLSTKNANFLWLKISETENLLCWILSLAEAWAWLKFTDTPVIKIVDYHNIDKIKWFFWKLWYFYRFVSVSEACIKCFWERYQWNTYRLGQSMNASLQIMQFYVTNLQIISMGQPTSFSSLKVNWLQSESVKR